jgi:hypothetical protein
VTVLALLSTVPAAAATAASRQRVSNSQYRFTFSLPPGWNQVSLKKANLGTMLGPHRQLTPSFSQSLHSEAASDASKGVLIFASSSSRDAGGSFPSVSVTAAHGVVASTGQLESGIKEGLAQGGAKSVTAKAVHYPFGTAVVSTYEEPDISAATGKLFGIQVYIEHASTVFIVTITAADKSLRTKSAGALLSTWRFS